MTMKASDIIREDGTVDARLLNNPSTSPDGHYGKVSEEKCSELREDLRELGTVAAVSEKHDMPMTTVRYHTTIGGCDRDAIDLEVIRDD